MEIKSDVVNVTSSKTDAVDHGVTMRRSVDAIALGYELIVLQGPDTGARLELRPGETGRVLIGTSAVCALSLKDPQVSRRHVALEFSGFELMVADLESTNGTFVNDTRVVSAYVDGRDTLRIGGTVLRVVAKPMTATPAPVARSFGRLVGESPRMLNVFALCERLAPTDVPVIVEGDTGTGKELLAECLHEASPRGNAPFIVLDCRTTPREMFDAVLYGDPNRDDGQSKAGVFEQANGGTLLIDEPGDLDMERQRTLLHALDRRDTARPGDERKLRSDVRIIVATSRDLDSLVESGKFREDLYFRLAGARIDLPPVRKRVTDVPLIAAAIWQRCGAVGGLPREFLERYSDYEWPGNVREIERAVERFAALGETASLLMNRSRRAPKASTDSDFVGTDVVTQVLQANLAFPEARRRVLEAFERAYVDKVLRDNMGVVARAAAASGIARRYFQTIRARRSK